jgi:uracil-DNA glycosylase
MSDNLGTSEILGLLDWYRAMGVDAALDTEPVDWLARGPVAPGQGYAWPSRDAANVISRDAANVISRGAVNVTSREAVNVTSREAAPPRVTPPNPRPVAPPPILEARPRPQTPLAPSEAETDARRIARTADTLETLEAALRGFSGCSLKATATKLCFYRGAAAARVMLIGDAPGRDEDIEGKPFAGRAGQLLDKMLKAIDLGEADVHITNVVYWRPPGERRPTPQETRACRPFLERQIELVKPEFIVALGDMAAKEVLGVSQGIMQLRGKWRDIKIGSVSVPALATLHPAYLLQTPEAKRLAWLDLLAIKARLAE